MRGTVAPETLLDRLWSKVDKHHESGCWVWLGARRKGYGRIELGGIPRRTRSTHRLVYEMAKGNVPNGLVLDHLCRNRACCNPEHVEPVTAGENVRRSPIVGRHGKHKLGRTRPLSTSCASGHPWVAESTYFRPDGTRTCRICNRESAARTQRVRIERRAAEATAD